MKRQEARRAVDRVLDGGDLRDAPREIAPAVSLLRAAAGLPDETTGVDEVPARIAALIRVGASSPSATVVRPPRPFPAWRPGVAVGTVAALLAGSTGLAMANLLPASVQHAAHGVLAHVGVHVPDSGTEASSTESDETPSSTDRTTPSTGGAPTSTPVGPNAVDGAAVAGLCHAAEAGGAASPKADHSVAMANLKAAAAKAGKSVDTYCAPFVNAPTTTTTTAAPSSDTVVHGHTDHPANPGGSGATGQTGASPHTAPTTPTTILKTPPVTPTDAGTKHTQPSTSPGDRGTQSNPSGRS